MKKHILVFGSVLMLVSFLSLGSPIHSNYSYQPENGLSYQDKTKIKKEELPEAARKTLESEDFKDWSFVAAYKTKEGEYEVELKKGNDTQTVKFDKDGKLKG